MLWTVSIQPNKKQKKDRKLVLAIPHIGGLTRAAFESLSTNRKTKTAAKDSDVTNSTRVEVSTLKSDKVSTSEIRTFYISYPVKNSPQYIL